MSHWYALYAYLEIPLRLTVQKAATPFATALILAMGDCEVGQEAFSSAVLELELGGSDMSLRAIFYWANLLAWFSYAGPLATPRTS